jgi:hypothetical protein
MRFGHPVPEPGGPARPFHQVSKLTWLLLGQGLRLHQADT